MDKVSIKEKILFATITSLIVGITVAIPLLQNINNLEHDLNVTRIESNKTKDELRVALLNNHIPFGSTVHDMQFWCETETSLKMEPISIDQLPAEPRTMCKIITEIEMYQDQNGEWFFDKSSGVNMEEYNAK